MTDIKIPETRIKFKDVFSLKNLYQMMHELLLEEGWFAEEGAPGNPASAHRFIETMYLENFYQKGLHSGGKGSYGGVHRRRAEMQRNCRVFQQIGQFCAGDSFDNHLCGGT